MRKSDAVAKYLNGSKMAKKVVSIIEKWDGTKTVKENAENLFSGKFMSAYQYKVKYSLSAKKAKRGRMKKITPTTINKNKAVKVKNPVTKVVATPVSSVSESV